MEKSRLWIVCDGFNWKCSTFVLTQHYFQQNENSPDFTDNIRKSELLHNGTIYQSANQMAANLEVSVSVYRMTGIV